MKSPITGKEMSLTRSNSSLTFRKEKFDYLSHSYICETSGEKFTSSKLDELNLVQVHNQYRDKYNLPFPPEIRSIRSRYKLSASKMSEILGLGVNSYRNYENEEVPSVSNGRLIQLADDPKKFRDMVRLCDTLSQKEKVSILERLDKIIYNSENNSFFLKMENYLLGSRLPDAISGYVRPDLTKLTEIVKFYSERLSPWKTVLNKLLFYTDFLAYRDNCFSMTGARYRAIKMGPVPNNYDSIYEYMHNSGEILMEDVSFSKSVSGYQFKKAADKYFNSGIFSKEEIQILELVSSKFEGMTTNEVIDFSHQEKAWTDNQEERKFIDYNYAFEITQI